MTYEFDGQCAPNGGVSPMQGQQTFSLGVYKTARKKNGGLKRGKVEVRVTGPVSRADDVRRLAEIVVAKLEAGWNDVPKRLNVTSHYGESLLRE